MSTKSYQGKSEFLGMNVSTAISQLRKMILFKLAQETNRDICFRCGERIATIKQFSIDHKKPWLNTDPNLFWDLDNIAFSHSGCNRAAARQTAEQRQARRLSMQGELNHNAVLTANQVRAMRAEYIPRKITIRELAEKYGVSKTSVWEIIHQLKWKHIL